MMLTKLKVIELLKHHQHVHYKWSNIKGQIWDSLQQSAVLVPLFLKDGEVRVWLTKRSQKLNHEGGTVAFPGGMRDSTDRDEVDTCLRESYEEIGLPTEDVEIICQLCPFLNKHKKGDILVTPVVGIVSENFRPKMNGDEVECVFSLPLKRFLDKKDHSGVVYPYKGVNICANLFRDEVNGEIMVTWGLTAAFCMQVAICVYKELPTFDWATGEFTPQVEDPFLDVKQYLIDLESVYVLEKCKL